jgi:hypothetical protein
VGARETFRYREDGWSWTWILAAPLFCLAAGVFEWATDAPVHWLMLTVCAVGSALCHAVMIGATRVHGRVRLTDTTYTQGTEDLELDRIAEVLPLPPAATGRFGGPGRTPASWETARTLGELREMPRRREAVGLRLDSGAEVRAWARDAPALHAALTAAVADSGPGSDSPADPADPVDPVDPA